MTVATTPSTKDLRAVANEAECDSADGRNRFHGLSYADGVAAALRWALGETKDHPYPTDER
jgi:hypothetical protein